MPSKREVQYFEQYAQYAAKCWVFGVDIDNGFMFPTRNRKKLFVQYVFLSWIIFMVLLCVYRNHILYQQLETNSGDIGWFVVYAILTVIHSAYLIWFAIFAIRKKELTNLWNQLLHYSRNGTDSNLDCKKREKFIWLGYCGLKSMIVTGGASLAVPEYFFFAKQDGWPFAIAIGFPVIIWSVAFFYVVMIGILPTYSLMFFLNVIDTLQMKISKPQPVEGIIRRFKMLTLLCKNFNGTYALTVIPSWKYLCAFAGMISLYIGLRVQLPHGADSCFLAISFIGLVYATLLANVLSIIWSTSKDFMVRLLIAVTDNGEMGRKSYLRRELMSMRPLRISVGGLYYMEAEAKLTFMAFVINGIANILIAFK